MNSSAIRQSFLDFFRARDHTVVPSASLLPDSPNLLFTNAGMNQFVPIFLAARKPDVGRWPGAIPGADTRAADTQKCIRAGGKHNDLEDVGLDTYHHTFFEMLGNWSFGDYFKAEAIGWAWELLVDRWHFPPDRLYATIYAPDRAAGDPADRDEEAWAHWADRFRAAGLDPGTHIRDGGKKDNFWMMGDTGPCGPCSEVHIDLTPAGDTGGALVNRGTADCIEIWNLVFIQFNANADGTFSPLPARHVDTGMGFERVCSIIQGTRGFSDFSRKISNYETDVFRPLFDRLEQLSGQRYRSTLPRPGPDGRPVPSSPQEHLDVAFRVIADHLRTLAFSIADGILPGNTDRNYVLRRILRRAVRYGRLLGFHRPFFFQLAGVLADTMGDVFPDVRTRLPQIEEVIRLEEESFNRTLDKGLALFEAEAATLATQTAAPGQPPQLAGPFAFRLYDEQGFPLDLTEVLARERGLTVDVAAFNRLMDAQRARARAAQKRQIIEVANLASAPATRFVGFTALDCDARVLDIVKAGDRHALLFDVSPCYAEMGGQVGDTGEADAGGNLWRIVDTRKTGDAWLHLIAGDDPPAPATPVHVRVDPARRAAIQRHHTATHLLHWALHEIVGRDATQKGSYVGPDKLTFDFAAAALTPAQLAEVERLVNEQIVANSPLTTAEAAYADVRSRPEIMQIFGEKYGDAVRVVQIGGRPGQLDGFSMELCGGTHCRATGEIGLFRIQSESAIAAGIRRIEAVAGLVARDLARAEADRLRDLAARLNSPLADLEKKLESTLGRQKDLEKQLQSLARKQAAQTAAALAAEAETVGAIPAVIRHLENATGDDLQAVADALGGRFAGVVVLAGTAGDTVALVATVAPALVGTIQAGRIIKEIAPLVGGKGGGRPEAARGGGKQPSGVTAALARARSLLG